MESAQNFGCPWWKLSILQWYHHVYFDLSDVCLDLGFEDVQLEFLEWKQVWINNDMFHVVGCLLMVLVGYVMNSVIFMCLVWFGFWYCCSNVVLYILYSTDMLEFGIIIHQSAAAFVTRLGRFAQLFSFPFGLAVVMCIIMRCFNEFRDEVLCLLFCLQFFVNIGDCHFEYSADENEFPQILLICHDTNWIL